MSIPNQSYPSERSRRRAPTTNGAPSGWVRHIGPVALNVVAIALSLGLFAIITGRILGPTDRGILVIFMTLSSVLMLIGSLGCNTSGRVRLVAQGRALDLELYLGLIIFLVFAQVLLSVGAGYLLLSATHSLPSPVVLVFFTLYSVLNLAGLMLRDGLSAFGHNAQATGADLVSAFSALALIVLISLLRGLTLKESLLCVVLGELAEFIYLLNRYKSHGMLVEPQYSRLSFQIQIRHGLPALVTDFGQAMVLRFDRLLLGLLASTAQVGIYSVAATLTEVMWIIPTSISQVVFHRVATAQVSVRQVRQLRLANLGLTLLGGGILAVIAPTLVHVLFGKAYEGAIQPLRILLIAALAIGCYRVDIACVSASDRLGRASSITTFGFALVVIGDFVLIPPFGLMGAAFASLIAYGFMAVLAAVQVHALSQTSTIDQPRVETDA